MPSAGDPSLELQEKQSSVINFLSLVAGERSYPVAILGGAVSVRLPPEGIRTSSGADVSHINWS